MRASSLLVCLAAALMGQSAAWGQPAPRAPGVIFVMNGAGGGFELTTGLLKAMSYSGDRFIVDTVIWSRFNSAPRDHTDHEGHMIGAQKLASRIQGLRSQQPNRKIYVVAFSSGNSVALEAMKKLPPDSVDRIIMLAASVSCSYDLGAALRASRTGIDTFYSYEDGVLETVSASCGTSDGVRGPAAGRFGFWLPSKASPLFPLYQQRLRQYPWQSGFVWTGNYGHHLDWTDFRFLQAYVLPLLRQSETAPTFPIHGK